MSLLRITEPSPGSHFRGQGSELGTMNLRMQLSKDKNTQWEKESMFRKHSASYYTFLRNPGRKEIFKDTRISNVPSANFGQESQIQS